MRDRQGDRESGSCAEREALEACRTGIGFRVLATEGTARRGRLTTAHGAVETPAFMPVGTAATVKALTPEMLQSAGTAMLLANTYHLMLRPGAERVARLGGLHRMMRWPGPILTDSGGYQVMSLAGLRRIDEDGVAFQSHVDGSRHRLDPERAVQLQRLLDADISMVLDECVALPAPPERVEDAMRRSLRWAERCKAAFRPRPGYGLFGIVQGGIDADSGAGAPPASSPSASTATPSAASPSARVRT